MGESYPWIKTSMILQIQINERVSTKTNNMQLSSWRTLSIWILKAELIIWILNMLILAILLVLGQNAESILASDFLTKVTLLEAGIALIVGGAIAFSGSVLPSKAKEAMTKSSEPWTLEKLKKSENTANKYIILGFIMFLIALLISMFGL